MEDLRHLPRCAACGERMEISQKPWLRVLGQDYHGTGSCKEKAKELMAHCEWAGGPGEGQ